MAFLLDRICPCCGAYWGPAETLGEPDDSPPHDGDVFFCISCRQFCRFEASGALRAPTPDEHADDMRSPRRLRAINAWLQSVGEALMPARIGRL